MTPEQEKEINDFRNKIKKLCDEHPHLGIFVIVDARDYEKGVFHFMGNLCAVCATEHAISWIISDRIQHNERISTNN